VKALAAAKTDPNLNLIASANMWRPKDSGKKASTREMTNNGVFSTGDPRNATAQRGREEIEADIQMIVKFIEGWKKISQ
jgi:creatinine amidohydrolase/Fe(II)-dependent formamide hydrolase-like protein